MNHNQPKSTKLPDIPPYEIIAELGSGGMGAVYKAVDRQLNRHVAIKLMHSESLQTATAQKRFWREIQLTARLANPYIIKLYNVGSCGDHSYLVMEYVEGLPLLEYARQHRPALEHCLILVANIAAGLHSAHSMDIIHRDIKPANILVRPDGNPVLLDFGLAKTTQVQDHSLTRSGQIIGTPNYMAPEQARGLRRQIDRRTDVYGLGTVLYELLAGRPVVEGQGLMDTLYQVVHRNPRPLNAVRPEIPKAVAKICRKALEKKQQHRYASAEAMGEDIRRYLAGHVPRAVGYYRRRKLLTATGLVAAVALFTAMLIGARYFLTPSIDARARHLYAASKQLAALEKWEEANAKLSEAFALLSELQRRSREFEDQLIAAWSWNYYLQGEAKLASLPEEAAIYFEKALAILAKYKCDDKPLKCKIHNQLLRAYFYAGDYENVYRIGLQLPRGGQASEVAIEWILAQASYYYAPDAGLASFRYLSKSPNREVRAGSLYFLGRIALDRRQPPTARAYLAQALAIAEKLDSSFSLRDQLYIDYCTSVLDSWTDSDGHDTLRRYLEAISSQSRATVKYKYTLARYYLRSLDDRRDAAAQIGTKIVALMDDCIEDNAQECEYFYLRSRGFSACRRYREATRDISIALELSTGRADIIAEKLQLLSKYADISQLQNYIQDIQWYISKDADIQPDLFADQRLQLRKNYERETGNSLARVEFSAARFDHFYHKYCSKSTEVRELAETVICNMRPAVKVLSRLQSEERRGGSQATRLRIELEKRITRQQHKRLLVKIMQIPWKRRNLSLRQFADRDNIAAMCNIVSGGDWPSLLRLQAAKVLARLPGLHPKNLLHRLRADSDAGLVARIVAARALDEVGMYFASDDFMLAYRGDDQFVHAMIIELLSLDSPEECRALLRYMREGDPKLKLLAAARFPLTVEPELRKQIIAILVAGHHRRDPQVRALSILSLWHCPDKFAGAESERLWALLAPYWSDLIEIIQQDSHPLVRQAALKDMFSLARIFGRREQLLAIIRKLLAASRDPLVRYAYIQALGNLEDRDTLQKLLLAPDTSFIERLAVLFGFLAAKEGLKSRSKRGWAMQLLCNIMNSSGDQRIQCFLINMLLLRSYDVDPRQNSLYRPFLSMMLAKVEPLLDSHDPFAQLWTIQAVSHCPEVSKSMLHKISQLAASSPHPHIRNAAFATLTALEFGGDAQLAASWSRRLAKMAKISPQRVRDYRLAAIFGPSGFTEIILLGDIYFHKLYRWDPVLIERHSRRYLMELGNDRRVCQDVLQKLTRVLKKLRELPDKLDMEQRYSMVTAILLDVSGKSSEAIELLQDICRRSNWQCPQLVGKLGLLLAGQGKQTQAIERLQQAITRFPDAIYATGSLVEICLRFGKAKELKQFLYRCYDLPLDHDLLFAALARHHPSAFARLAHYHYADPQQRDRCLAILARIRERFYPKWFRRYLPDRAFSDAPEFYFEAMHSMRERLAATALWHKKQKLSSYPIGISRDAQSGNWRVVLLDHAKIGDIISGVGEHWGMPQNLRQMLAAVHRKSRKYNYLSGFPHSASNLGTLALRREAGEIKDIPLAQLGYPKTDSEYFARVHSWATDRGYCSGVPTFIFNYHRSSVRVVLIYKNAATMRIVPTAKLLKYAPVETRTR